MMGSMNIRDWTWTCKLEHSIYLSFISTKHVFILLAQKPSLTCPARFMKDWLLLHSCVSCKRPPLKGQACTAGRMLPKLAHRASLRPSDKSRVSPRGARAHRRAGRGFHFGHSFTRKDAALSYKPGFWEVRQLIALYDLGNGMFWGLIKINPGTCYKADTFEMKEWAEAFFLFEARIGRAACRVTKCRGGQDAAAVAFPCNNWSAWLLQEGPLLPP